MTSVCSKSGPERPGREGGDEKDEGDPPPLL